MMLCGDFLEHIIKFRESIKDNRILLLLDNYSSYIFQPFVYTPKENGITLIPLHSHISLMTTLHMAIQGTLQ